MTADSPDTPDVEDVVERWSEVRATRVRRLTSAVILIGAPVGAAAAAIGGSPLAALIAIAIWGVMIVGTLWLFRHRRRSR